MHVRTPGYRAPNAQLLIYACALLAVIADSTLGTAGAWAAIAIAILGFGTAAVQLWRWVRGRRGRKHFAQFLHRANELQVELTRLDLPAWMEQRDSEFPDLKIRIDELFCEAEAFVEKRNKTLGPLLRSDAGMAQRRGMDDLSYFVVWLPQRIKQMEKILSQL